jgi:hypothetical protein
MNTETTKIKIAGQEFNSLCEFYGHLDQLAADKAKRWQESEKRIKKLQSELIDIYAAQYRTLRALTVTCAVGLMGLIALLLAWL